MSLRMIADQYIEIGGEEVNIHDIKTIYVDDMGVIKAFAQEAQMELVEETLSPAGLEEALFGK